MANEFDVAIIGMSCRFPGADTPDEFWRNLIGGVESISALSEAELLAAGVPPELLARPDYVKASPVLADPAAFDAAFFGFAPAEAAVLDPQHRVLLELAQSALEDAGCDPARFAGRIGVFAGSAMNTYFASAGLAGRLTENYLPTLIASDKDFLATRISYKLGLRGPSLTVQTACSTSLVAIHLARQSLLSGESDAALAGAVSIRVPHRVGYVRDGGVASADGHVRAFDADATGTIFGSGAGVIVLKRLADAIEQGDCIRAVIKGSAVNNDGAQKAGYAAPSVEGQADAVVEALANSGLSAEAVSYVEAHGSGTPLGDPIEVRALSQAFRRFTARTGYCALGSVKPNIGHLDAAAGMAGMIKTTLALQRGRIPPTLHFRRPNPEIDFSVTPFFVDGSPREWPRSGEPRRAGVMATGMGGTNAHVVLEEAPAPAPAEAEAGAELLIVSAKTAGALRSAAAELSRRLAQSAEGAPLSLADVAHTLQTGRGSYPHRRFVLCRTVAEGAALLADGKTEGASGDCAPSEAPAVVFLLPGIGDHYAGMSRGLYRRFLAFRAEVDRCAELLTPLIGSDIRELLVPDDWPEPEAGQPRGIDLKRMLGREAQAGSHPAAVRLQQTLYSQCALFTVEYALARLWMHWGVTPARLVGHSMGEYVAACLAGVFTLPEAVRLIAGRARLVSALPEGGMLAVMMGEAELRPLLPEGVSISLINGPQLCVVAGEPDRLERFKAELAKRKAITRPVRNGHAFHSRLLDPIVGEFVRELRTIRLQPPAIPFISNVTGTWITAAQATDPNYWAEHARSTARFSDALAELWRLPDSILLEVGPGRTLGLLALQHPARGSGRKPAVLASLRHDYENQPDAEVLLASLGRLWLAGARIDWDRVDPRPGRQKVPLPTYPFERTRHWIEAAPAAPAAGRDDASAGDRPPLDQWFYVPSWSQETPARPAAAWERSAWLIAGEDSPYARALADLLRSAGASVLRAEAGAGSADYDGVLRKVPPGSALNVIYLGGLASPADPAASFLRLLHLVQALGERSAGRQVKLAVVSSQVHEVTGDERLHAAMASASGLAQVISREYPGFTAFAVDLPDQEQGARRDWTRPLLDEFHAPLDGRIVAYRGRHRWVRHFRPQPLGGESARFRPRGVYLITGGTGGLGLAIARHLAEQCQARLILIKKRPWESGAPDEVLAGHLREIERLGGTVEISVCDVTDRAGMQRVIAEIVRRHGAIHGAIHAAGILRDGLIQLKSDEAARAVLSPKIDGAVILHELVQSLPLDFCVLFSSLSSVLPFHGQGDYSAANAFLDAFAFEASARTAFPTVAIDWPVWREVGILTQMETLAGFEGMHQAVLNRAVSPADGVEIFQRAVASGFTQILVSPQRFEAARREATDRRLIDAEATSAAGPGQPAEAERRLPDSDQPQDDVELTVAELWTKILGTAAIGRNQNFLDLGGHSLLAMRIVAGITSEYQVDFTLRRFFEAPTIAGTAAAIRSLVEAEIGNLSDEEVSRLSS